MRHLWRINYGERTSTSTLALGYIRPIGLNVLGYQCRLPMSPDTATLLSSLVLIEKEVMNLMKSEATARLTFVYLGRAKRIVDLLVEPTPFDKPPKLGNKPTLNIRLEEKRSQLKHVWGTRSSMLDCHVLKGFGIYMIGILDSLSDVVLHICLLLV